jgi:pantoate--beta-alanine ligase
MRVLRTIAEVRQHLGALASGTRIGFVPTMGALHDGHVRCFAAALAHSDHVVASVFVNPTQFDDPSDLERYPRREEEDARIAGDAGVDTLFVPSADEMYPEGFDTAIDPGEPAAGLEGAHRPGHFAGVATVCVKLFSIARPSAAFFGQKDAQQVAVVRHVVRDLNLDLAIEVVPTVRDEDGLALSSRNARLSPDERRRALAIPRALAAGLEAFAKGLDPVGPAEAVLHGLEVDYVAVREFETGEPVLLVAATLGSTRLIDNVPLTHPELAGMPQAPSAGALR